MDDFNVSSLHESKNEWGARLLTIFTPFVIEGFKSIFDESLKLCKDNNEHNKYLMTFQNFITRIPKWNSNIIEQEKNRIIEKSGCKYLEELITCVHIIQLKLLTAIRVSSKQKKIDITIPKIDDFIHKIYINIARKLYKNVYLFEINITSLQIQKHNRELEIIVQECILNTIRDSIPVENILKAYMSENVEEEVIEEIKEEFIPAPEPIQQIQSGGQVMPDQVLPFVPKSNKGIQFNDVDASRDINNNDENIVAPKDYERLDMISNERAKQRKIDEQDDDDNEKIKIFDEIVSISPTDTFDAPQIKMQAINLLGDIEELI